MSTTHHILSLAGSLLCAAALHAGTAASDKTGTGPATSDPTDAKAEPSQTYQLKNRSAFSCASEDARAPFWPVGWVHRKGASAVVASVAAPRATLDERSFRVTSILLGSGTSPSLAVINGRAYSEGEFLKMPRGTPGTAPAAPGTPAAPAAARIRVQRIVDGSVVLQSSEQMLTVSMQRQELLQKKVEEPLLDEER